MRQRCGATSPRACSTTCYADCGVLVSLQYRSRMFPSYALQYHCDPIKHAWHMSAAAASSWLSDKSSQFEIPCHGKRCVRFNAAQYLFRLRELLRWCRRGKVPPFGAASHSPQASELCCARFDDSFLCMGHKLFLKLIPHPSLPLISITLDPGSWLLILG